jgi:hypothetical protein
MTQTNTTSVPGAAADIVARYDRDYRIKRFVIVLVMVGMAAWFGYDGWKGWPTRNSKIDEVKRERAIVDKQVQALRDARKTPSEDLLKQASELQKREDELGTPKTGTDIWFQKFLASILPVAGIAYLIVTLYKSRGEYRLSGQTLSVPGHPPVELEQIRQIDKSRWDRKGIAVLEYELPNSTGRRKITLDDFVYQRKAIDAIFERIQDQVVGPAPEPEAVKTPPRPKL